MNRIILDVINGALKEKGLKELKYVASTNGGEWAGPCPRCKEITDDGKDGGNDRLRVWPFRSVEWDGKGVCYRCRECFSVKYPGDKWSGDLIQFVRDVYNMNWKEARTYLNLPEAKEPTRVLSVSALSHIPNRTWQERGMKVVSDAVEFLHSDEGEGAYWYLEEDRVFTKQTITDMQYGYLPCDVETDGEEWGLVGKIVIPAGIVIPEFHTMQGELQLWSINIRRSDADIEYELLKGNKLEKYHAVKGSSKSGLYLADCLKVADLDTRDVFLCEGQFDAAMLKQVGGDILVVATAGASSKPRQDFISLLRFAKHVHVVGDNDKAGKDMVKSWMDTLPNAIPFFYQGHDINSAVKKGIDIRPAILRAITEAPQRLLDREKLQSDDYYTRVEEIVHSGLTEQHIAIPALKHSTIVIPKLKTSIAEEGVKVQRDVAKMALQSDSDVPVSETSKDMGNPQETALLSSWLKCRACNNEGVLTDVYGKRYCEEHYPGDEGILLNNVSDLWEWIAAHCGESYEDLFMKSMDLETTGLDPFTSKIVSITMDSPVGSLIIDTRPYYSASDVDKEQWVSAIQELFKGDVTWIGHNIKFDLYFLAIHFGVRVDNVYDTMIIEKVINAGKPGSVSMLETAKRYGYLVSKEERSWFIDLDKKKHLWNSAFPKIQRWYMTQDILVPKLIQQKQARSIHDQHLEHVVYIENKALPAICAMQTKGILIDKDHWSSIIKEANKEHAQLENTIQKVLGSAIDKKRGVKQETLFGDEVSTTVNLSSAYQVKSALRLLGVEVESIKREDLEKVANAHPVIPTMIEWKKLEKFTNSFGEGLLQYIAKDGRIHANFEQLGAVTGRMSCREPNLQQIPKSNEESYDIRRCFVAPGGSILAIADLPNIELRILAELANDETMLMFFEQEKDLHSETARMMFGLSDDIDPAEYYINGIQARFAAKSINFGLAYGMGPQGLARRIGSTLEVAKELMRSYFDMYKGVARYLKVSGAKGVADTYAVSRSGRRRNFGHMNLLDPAIRSEVERASKNHPIQALNADIIKVALATLYRDLPPECHTVLVVHDEIVVEAPLAMQEEAKAILAENMYDACREYLKKVYIPPQKVSLSPYWMK